MAHPRGIEPRIAVLEAATVTVRSGAWYSRQESNLHVDTRFERAASTGPRGHPATGVKLVGRGRVELPCTRRLVLSEVCLPNSGAPSGPGPCPGRASNPQDCSSQPQASAIAPPGQTGARGRTRTYVATKGQPGYGRSVLPLTHTRVNLGCQRTWWRAGDSNPDVPKRRNLSRILGYRLPMLSAALRSRDQYQNCDDRDKLDRRVQRCEL
jgi:hypothetical protein